MDLIYGIDNLYYLNTKLAISDPCLILHVIL